MDPQGGSSDKAAGEGKDRSSKPEASSTTATATQKEKAAATETQLIVRGDAHARRELQTRDTSPGFLSRITPSQRRVVMTMGKAGIAIADGLLLSRSRILNPLLSAGFLAYDCLSAVNDYRTGALNRIGYATSGADVALRIGKSVGLAALGVGIGQAVGALIGLSAIPVVGQLILSTVLSVGLGICVGALITRYVDKLFIKMQIRMHYKYPADERGARRRFEALLAARADLTTLESCKVVQHYADYRVASGWESANDIDDYRASGDVRLMPVSLQHFAVVQLQRKWGFLHDRRACRKVFKALMLVHHPDRNHGQGGAMAAQLKTDYELYAFCQGWLEDCPALLAGTAPGEATRDPAGGTRRKRNIVVDFIRSLFRPVTSSHYEAEDLHRYGLLALEAGDTAARAWAAQQEAGGGEGGEGEALSLASSFTLRDSTSSRGGGDGALPPLDDADDAEGHTDSAVQQQGVARVLAALARQYEATVDAVTHLGLARVCLTRQGAGGRSDWEALLRQCALFNRMQQFIVACGGTTAEGEPAVHRCAGAVWRTAAEAQALRETARVQILQTVFTDDVMARLKKANEVWGAGRDMAANYFRQCAECEAAADSDASAGASASGGGGAKPKLPDDGAAHMVESLLSAQKQLHELQKPQEEAEAAMPLPMVEPQLYRTFKSVGLTATAALAGEHARGTVEEVRATVRRYCDEVWPRHRRTLRAARAEAEDARREEAALRQQLQQADITSAAREDLKARLAVQQQRLADFDTQLSLIRQQAAEADVLAIELLDACVVHLPELLPTLEHDGDDNNNNNNNGGGELQLEFERRRSLWTHYTHIEGADEAGTGGGGGGGGGGALVSFCVLAAVYEEPLTGAASPCWLKRYTFAPAAAGATAEQRRLHTAWTRHLRGVILQEELAVARQCASPLVLSPTEYFIDDEDGALVLHMPRRPTQQRYTAAADVGRQLEPLGLRWLLDALRAVAELHGECGLAHGDVRLSAFTHDSYGSVALGFFAPASGFSAAHAAAVAGLRSGALPPAAAAVPATAAAERLARECASDVADFGMLLLAEVLPQLTGTRVSAAEAAADPRAAGFREMSRVYKEVGERLLGRLEPRWGIPKACHFVRRLLQAAVDGLSVDSFFSKAVSCPARWAVRRPRAGLLLRRASLPSLAGAAAVWRNENAAVWEGYWRCRRKMSREARQRSGAYTGLRVVLGRDPPPPPLPTTDDCEVNERFLWLPCAEEEAAWALCRDGFSLAPAAAAAGGDGHPDGGADCSFATAYLAIPPPGEGRRWGVLLRASLGTIMVAAEYGRRETGHRCEAGDEEKSAVTVASKRRSYLSEDGAMVRVPCPAFRCYPEYVVQFA